MLAQVMSVAKENDEVVETRSARQMMEVNTMNTVEGDRQRGNPFDGDIDIRSVRRSQILDDSLAAVFRRNGVRDVFCSNISYASTGMAEEEEV